MSLRKLPPRKTSNDWRGYFALQVFVGAIVVALALLVGGLIASYVHQ